MTKKQESKVEERPPIKIDCTIPGKEGEHALFKSTGWKFRHLRLWESTPTVEGVVKLIHERLVGWNLTDENGKAIKFPTKYAAGIFDDLDPAQAGWITAAFRLAYGQAGNPPPNE